MSNDEKPSEDLKDPPVVASKPRPPRLKELPANKAATLPKAFKASKAPKPRLDTAHNAAEVLSLDRAPKNAAASRSRAAANKVAATDGPQARRGVTNGGDKQRNGTSEKSATKPRAGKTMDPAPIAPGRTKTTRSAAVVPKGKVGKIETAAAATTNDDGAAAAAISLQEMGAHLKRLTEEHAKLQTEYARVRTLLQDANVKSSSRIGSPVPSATEAAGADAGDAAAVTAARAVELERGVSEDGSSGGGGEDTREGFRREVLRLKEELLAAQQQLTCVTESKNMSEQELAQLMLRTEETGQELLSRDRLIEQLSRQVLQLKARANMTKAEHMQKIEEKEEEAKALARRLKEAEKESRETKEFMQEENNSLSDALGEAEERVASYHTELGRIQYELEAKERHCHVLSHALEQKQIQLQQSQADLADTQDGAKELLLKQGAELNGCSAVARRIHRVAESITKRILSEAEALGVDVGHNEAYKKRRSSDGRKLVWAILQAARTGEDKDKDKDKDNGFARDNEMTKGGGGGGGGGVNGSATMSKEDDDEVTFDLSSQMKEVEAGIVTLGRIQQTVNQFLFALMNDAETEKTKLEKDAICERRRLDEMQSELEENVRRRWALEERNKELQKDLAEAKEGLRDSRNALKNMWDKIDEKANWLIENKKLKEEIDGLKKQNGQLEARIGLLSAELQETIANYEEAAVQRGNAEPLIGEYAKKQVSLKTEISSLHRLLMDREEEMLEKSKKHERHQEIVKNNLAKAEHEVRRLDAILDHVFAVLKSASDLHEHPMLKKLWENLDGEIVADAVEV